uniref:hydroxyacid oxidase 1-like isoform X2 n=1 Tax=Styela clava TaxID=7725 RepID=UPI00193A5609|nr:hydroxyacid oxidase 1-like isoform X2 [Styela clava]
MSTISVYCQTFKALKSMENLLPSVSHYEDEARRKLSQHDFGYFAFAAGARETMKENCEAFKRWRFRPKNLQNVSRVDCATTVIGSKIPFPICIAPTAFHRLCTQEGEFCTARAAESLGVGMAVSLWSNKTMEEIASDVPNCIKWCHVQLSKNRNLTKHFVRRAEQNGFKGFIVTIDEPVFRNRTHRYEDGSPFTFKTSIVSRNIAQSIKFVEPDKPHFASFQSWMDGSVEWDSIDWLKDITILPVVVKGILTGEMALKAVDHKVDGIIVSNHGGRILDSTFATIDVLPEVVKAVNCRVDVYFDGGIRKGTDVAKAIALGAKAIFVGRPILWGLACKGEEGVRNVLEILRNEFIHTMRLLDRKCNSRWHISP